MIMHGVRQVPHAVKRYQELALVRGLAAETVPERNAHLFFCERAVQVY